MPTKDELIEKALELGLTVPDGATKAEIEALIAEAPEPEPETTPPTNFSPGPVISINSETEPAPIVARAKLNRGSSRRITREKEKLETALDAAIEEFDRQMFVVGEDGKRAGPCPLVEHLRETKKLVNEAVNEALGL